ncbi:HPr(Ser) kinase/phosphatase [Lapidilactobacillus luobeiensis]|uniref:HPr(Ser) kinase/phosphatase n=1 Tax=Lapidilactobacillus luobeiensis TaxID=2950371 RepID=UPI0021C40B1D|nr:HPr(Ser) kinase/phosphatase [Lapidilactobacillus luobeiensis]
MAEGITVRQLVDAVGLQVFSGKEFLDDRQITISDISRPGLELTGYFTYYPHNRLQVFGRTESAFAASLTAGERKVIFQRMSEKDTPAMVISRSLPAPDELIAMAGAVGIPVLGSDLPTTRLSSVLTEYLHDQLAERRSMHGVLVDVYGLGVLIVGNSGVGKSETALELVKRGHRLIADDRVDVYQKDENTIVGEAPKILKNLMEIRGIGIIDVMNLFGAGAVRTETEISLIVNLENWQKDQNYDRLGSNEAKQMIFDVSIPKITIPVKVGRNLAIIIEVAAMNFRARKMGYDATELFEKNLSSLIKENSIKDEGGH